MEELAPYPTSALKTAGGNYNPTIRQRLENRRKEFEDLSDETAEAIALLDANPEIAQVIEALVKARILGNHF